MRPRRARRLPPASLRADALALISLCLVALPRIAHAEEAAPPAAAEAPDAAEAAPPAAQEPPAPAEAAPPAAREPPAPPKPPPYSLPFQLRPAAAGTVVRLDTAFAFYRDPVTDQSGSTVVPVLTASYKITKNFAPVVRLGVVQNAPPTGASGFGFLNPLLGATYAFQLAPELKLAFFLGATVPIGSGGGDHPDAGQKVARSAGIFARSAMDNALFAVNDFTVLPGVDFAFVSGGFTAQVEATLLQLTRVRGSVDQKDSSKTNFTAGIHVGYFFIPLLSAGVELRHQRWLSTPLQVKNDTTGTLRDTTTVAFGPRLHIQIGEGKWFRPAVALALPLDDPMKRANEKIVQLDLPFSF